MAIRRRAVWLAAAFVFVLGNLVTLTAGPAIATNWFGPSGISGPCVKFGNITDNKDVYFWYNGGTEMENAANWTRSNLLDPTTLDTFYAASLTSATDVVLIDGYWSTTCQPDYGVAWTTNGTTGLIGATSCQSTAPNFRCQQQLIRISRHWFDAHLTAGDRWIVCHEVGHAIGLDHRNSAPGCMVTGRGVSDRVYTAHDLGHINGAW